MDALIKHLNAGEHLSNAEISAASEFLLDPDLPGEHKESFLKALAQKGETPQEIAGFVETFLEHSVDPGIDDLDFDGPTIDLCGTGGDGLHLFNVSTTSMFVLAAGGATVLKHGNRGITSKSGSADVLEALGICIDSGLDVFQSCVEQAGVGFMFAPSYHPSFKAVSQVRQSLAQQGVTTIFNLIGPLLNPGRPECQLIGVTNASLAPVYTEILQRLDRDSAWVVNGQTEDGRPVDEVSIMGKTMVFKSGSYQELADEEFVPADFDLQSASLEDLIGGNAEENADILTEILSGVREGPRRDMVLMNAGAGLACAGLVDNVGDGIELARSLINSGEALERLKLMQDIAGDS